MCLHLGNEGVTGKWQIFVAQSDAFQHSDYKELNDTGQQRDNIEHYSSASAGKCVEMKSIHPCMENTANLGSVCDAKLGIILIMIKDKGPYFVYYLKSESASLGFKPSLCFGNGWVISLMFAGIYLSSGSSGIECYSVVHLLLLNIYTELKYETLRCDVR